jgi:dCMP deaminase
MGNKQREWDITFINIAKEMAKHSTCIRKQVGAILVKNGHIVSTGYNGVPHGVKHCNEVFKKEDMLKPDWMDVHGKFSSMYEVHAEQNCIIEMAKNETNPEGSTLYLTLSPCSNCAKLIVAAGITRVVYEEKYDRDTSGIDLLNNMGVECVQLS